MAAATSYPGDVFRDTSPGAWESSASGKRTRRQAEDKVQVARSPAGHVGHLALCPPLLGWAGAAPAPGSMGFLGYLVLVHLNICLYVFNLCVCLSVESTMTSHCLPSRWRLSVQSESQKRKRSAPWALLLEWENVVAVTSSRGCAGRVRPSSGSSSFPAPQALADQQKAQQPAVAQPPPPQPQPPPPPQQPPPPLPQPQAAGSQPPAGPPAVQSQPQPQPQTQTQPVQAPAKAQPAITTGGSAAVLVSRDLLTGFPSTGSHPHPHLIQVLSVKTKLVASSNTFLGCRPSSEEMGKGLVSPQRNCVFSPRFCHFTPPRLLWA